MQSRIAYAFIVLPLIFSLIVSFTARRCGNAAARNGAERPDGKSGLRMPVDTVGYARASADIEAVIALADSLEADRYAENEERFGRAEEARMVGAIAPHDDHLYAGRIYVHALREIRAPLVVLFGVCHAARRRGLQGKLVFDSFEAWKGPYGPCAVSPLRDEVIAALPPGMVRVSNELHALEHSLEAFIPFLQHYFRDVRILPVLVTRLEGPLFAEAAARMADALHEVTSRRGMELGTDYTILISADCVHYGDDRWGGRNYAPFGVDREGYDKAVAQDLSIVRTCLARTLSGESIACFRERVERDDLEWPYKVTWCGVYSIPFGLSVLLGVAERAGREPPAGHLLRYGTSIDPGPMHLGETDLGVTNINTLRHWVGYVAVGYW
jgi:AmmeMemoRadiSam system protein B